MDTSATRQKEKRKRNTRDEILANANPGKDISIANGKCSFFILRHELKPMTDIMYFFVNDFYENRIYPTPH